MFWNDAEEKRPSPRIIEGRRFVVVRTRDSGTQKRRRPLPKLELIGFLVQNAAIF